MVPNIAARQVLAKAAMVAGGVDKLAARFGMSPRVLKLCIEGGQKIPDELYLRAVDVVLDEIAEPPSRQPDPSDPEAKPDPSGG